MHGGDRALERGVERTRQKAVALVELHEIEIRLLFCEPEQREIVANLVG